MIVDLEKLNFLLVTLIQETGRLPTVRSFQLDKTLLYIQFLEQHTVVMGVQLLHFLIYKKKLQWVQENLLFLVKVLEVL